MSIPVLSEGDGLRAQRPNMYGVTVLVGSKADTFEETERC